MLGGMIAQIAYVIFTDILREKRVALYCLVEMKSLVSTQPLLLWSHFFSVMLC